jgi:hypothetical protein
MHEDGSGAMNFACAAFQIILSSDGMNDARETVNVLRFRGLAGTRSVLLKSYATSNDGKVSSLGLLEGVLGLQPRKNLFPCLWRH